MLTAEHNEGVEQVTPLTKMDAARDAYEERDVQASIVAHQHGHHKHHKESHMSGGNYIKDIVFGGLDGILEQFAIVASVAGAGFDPEVAMVLGISTLVADAFSMAFGDSLSIYAHRQFVMNERKREQWECENYLEGEKLEMINIYKKKGLSDEHARRVVDILSSQKELFVDVMMTEELSLMPIDEDENPIKNGLVMFISFILFGAVPIVAYILLSFTKHSTIILSVTAAITVLTLFLLGFIKGRLENQGRARTRRGIRRILQSSFEVVITGITTASASYLIGWGLNEAAQYL